MDRKVQSILAAGIAAVFAAGVVAAPNEPPAPNEPMAESQAAEQSADGAITEKVKEALAADSALAVSEIQVETVGGEVRLNGTVGNAAEVQRATAIAFGVTGVKKVQNNLKAK